MNMVYRLCLHYSQTCTKRSPGQADSPENCFPYSLLMRTRRSARKGIVAPTFPRGTFEVRNANLDAIQSWNVVESGVR